MGRWEIGRSAAAATRPGLGSEIPAAVGLAGSAIGSSGSANGAARAVGLAQSSATQYIYALIISA